MAPRKDRNSSLRRQLRSLATCLTLVAFVGTSYRCLRLDAYSRLLSGTTHLVFPSGDVTLAKLLWLGMGMALAAVHLGDVLDKCRRRWTPGGGGGRLYLVDECSRPHSRIPFLISGTDVLRQVQVETPQFQGRVAIAATRSSFGLQVQGRFIRNIPVNSRLFLALELPVEGEDLGWTLKMLVAAMNKLCRWNSVHLSRGDNNADGEKDLELPHFAVPLLSCEHSQFGAGFDGHKRQVNSYAVGKVYTLEASIADWRMRWLASLMLAVLEWFPVAWIAIPPLHVAGYSVTPSSKRDQQALKQSCHSAVNKRYLFCFSVHGQKELQQSADAQRLRISLPQDGQSLDFEVGSPIALYSGNGLRGGGVPWAHAEACRRIAEDARALGRLSSSLDVWVEFVDRVAGRRKVGYLLEVVDMAQQIRRTVMRSATTVKNALLLLRLEHQIDRKETERETGIAEIEDMDAEQVDEPVDFQNLTVESREYRYEQIERETTAVAHVLAQVASDPAQGRRRWRQPQRCYQNQLEKATLYRCLMSPSRLPSVPNYHAIGVQINESQHLAMNVVCEAGIYRLHGAGDGTTPLLRQEWFIVSADHLHFFRSFSVSPSLSIPITNVLNVCSIDHVGLLNGNKPIDMHQQEGAVPRWFGLEVHLVLEVITLFVETPEEREQLVASLQPLTIDDCDVNVLSAPVKGARSEAVAASPLFSSMTLTSQNQPVCLNQRTSRFVDTLQKKVDASAALKLLHMSLEAGLKVFALGETAARLRINRPTVLCFLGEVEKLNSLDLDQVASEMSSEDRFALGLNLYHTLFIHAVLIFGYPQSHEQWKLLQTVACYLMRVNDGSESVRYTLADIQRVVLRCPVPVTLEASSLTRSLSQNALMDLAIGGGDAINGLCRTVLGVAWTPVLPSSSSYAAVKKTPLPIPAGLAIDGADIRTSLVLQINSSPPSAKTTGTMRVYDGGQKLNEQLNTTCTLFLSRELRLDEVNRVINLPRVCEWYRVGHSDEEVDDQDDGINRRMGPLSQRSRRRSSSGSVGGVAALPKSRSFYCLQRLLGFMEVEQHHRAMHLLLGAGDECRFVFDEFWTRRSRSGAASLLSSAGSAALSVFSGSSANSAVGSQQSNPVVTGTDGEWFVVGQQSLRTCF
ncbi:hypothetical protein PHYPSEUDO_003964 [Phytophthora pseudosyringae]|uniref:DUF547 domain-containing protein n=1 Tax=Phytophthora pseudosyringae TaxID=221518 RepID=A0A8T1VPI6_9STRA|nr:hypothetical protein PHYPSEUDO_003964 [Phytophthora pseudosyringae]